MTREEVGLNILLSELANYLTNDTLFLYYDEFSKINELNYIIKLLLEIHNNKKIYLKVPINLALYEEYQNVLLNNDSNQFLHADGYMRFNDFNKIYDLLLYQKNAKNVKLYYEENTLKFINFCSQFNFKIKCSLFALTSFNLKLNQIKESIDLQSKNVINSSLVIETIKTLPTLPPQDILYWFPKLSNMIWFVYDSKTNKINFKESPRHLIYNTHQREVIVQQLHNFVATTFDATASVITGVICSSKSFDNNYNFNIVKIENAITKEDAKLLLTALQNINLDKNFIQTTPIFDPMTKTVVPTVFNNDKTINKNYYKNKVINVKDIRFVKKNDISTIYKIHPNNYTVRKIVEVALKKKKKK